MVRPFLIGRTTPKDGIINIWNMWHVPNKESKTTQPQW